MSLSNETIKALLTEFPNPSLPKIEEQLKKLFGALAIRDDWNTGENYVFLIGWNLEHSIDLIIRNIIHSIILRPHIEKLSKGSAKKDIQKVLDAASSLANALRGLHVPALLSLDNKINLEEWKENLDRFVRDIEGTEISTSPGRPKKSTEQLIAFELCLYWLCFKGEPPNQSMKRGHFVPFLTDVFEALGFTGAADQAKIAVGRLNTTKPEEYL